MRRVLGVVVAVAVVLAAAACSGDDDSAASTSPSRAATSTSRSTTTKPRTTTSNTVAPSTVTPTTTCAAPGGAAFPPKTSPMPSDVMVLKTVAVATHGCTNTVRFAFGSGAPEPPGYRVEYQNGPFEQDPSGKPVSVSGSAFLVVRLEPATGFDFVNNKQSYTGPDRIKVASGGFVTEAVLLGDFESVMTWVIGLRERVSFTAQATGAPNHQLTIAIG